MGGQSFPTQLRPGHFWERPVHRGCLRSFVVVPTGHSPLAAQAPTRARAASGLPEPDISNGVSNETSLARGDRRRCPAVRACERCAEKTPTTGPAAGKQLVIATFDNETESGGNLLYDVVASDKRVAGKLEVVVNDDAGSDISNMWAP